MNLDIFHFAWSMIWNATLLLAFFGWGQLLLGCLGRETPSIGVSACVGIALAVCVGGILNLFQLITPGILIGFTLAGAVLAVVQILRRRNAELSLEAGAIVQVWRGNWDWKWLVLPCFVVLLSLRAASTPTVSHYLPTDDENFYLVMPVKMLQTHHYAADPYSERRIESSVGGSYFLHCLELCALPLKNLQMSDHFVGLVLIVLLGQALARHFGLSPPETTILGIASVSLMPPDFNLTFSILPSAFWLAMVLITLQRPSFVHPMVVPWIVGSMAGTLVALKSTYLPFAALFCGALFPVLGWDKGWKGALSIWSAALMGALIVLVPWMVAMRMTSGTFLYPVLGSGYDFSAYHQFSTPFSAHPLKILRTGDTYYVPLILIISAQIFLLRRGSKASTLLLLSAVICLFSSLATGFATGDDDTQRYVFPIVLPTFLLSYIQLAAESRARPDWKPGPFFLAGTLVVILAGIGIHASRGQYYWKWWEVCTSFTDRAMEPSETRQEYANMGAALRKDGLTLATLQDPYLLDFSDEKTYIADYPGCAGLPPGWPVKGDGDALAEYLISHSIRYLAYSYAGNAQLDYCVSVFPKLKSKSLRSGAQFGTYLVANKQYLELRQSRKTIYDDGKVFIVDLSARVPQP